ncbi:hypothetical protein COLO4_20959 [Corchorus olitorius]|uniref:Uncharacterized protein n=1 Tax=Corchorus olitorius TaxID=93759 RepID=A0A1R3IVW7_9ROSI|nr:hypothetical protein COLO4_20959 [Corchorus olitorius]
MEVPLAEWLQSSGVLLGYLSSFDLSTQFQKEREDQCETILWEGFWRVLFCGEIEGIEAFERADGRVLEVERLWREPKKNEVRFLFFEDCVREVSGQENPRKWERGFERWLRGEFMEPIKMDQRGNRWLVGAGRVDCNIATLETVYSLLWKPWHLRERKRKAKGKESFDECTMLLCI